MARDLQRTFRRIAIVNRGEPAMRLIHAVRDFNQEHGTDLRTIALFTDPDRRAMFVREADEAYCLGSAMRTGPEDRRRESRYLDLDGLARALVETGAEAAWPGWGFVAERAEFAERCEAIGVTFIGPPATVIRRLGDKIAAKRLAEEAGLPIAPWSGGPVASLADARAKAAQLGFPLMLKASAGGGGRGIRRIDALADLDRAYEGARAEALSAFGDGRLFLERRLEPARHVEVQIIGDAHGTVWAVGVRDCSIQRRSQKVVEESASTALSPAQHRELSAAAARLASAAGYVSAGTVELLYSPPERRFAFLEVNTRLQVEHPVTEQTTGLDLVKLQLHVARGGRLEGKPPEARGHAVEARLNAEDPANGFAPAPGVVRLFRPPKGPGIRVDTALTTRDTIPAEFDSMIAKIVAHGRDRSEALARLRRALGETTVVIQGGTTNKSFLMQLLARPEVAKGELDIGWLERVADQICQPPSGRGHAHVALVQAAVEAYDAQLALELTAFRASAVGGRPELPIAVGFEADLGYRGNAYELTVYRLAKGRYRVRADQRVTEIEVERFGDHERRVRCGCGTFHVVVVDQQAELLVEVEGSPYRVSRGDRGLVRAPAPAVVLAIEVEVGAAVAVGDRVLVLEAMKMEMPVTAPLPGRVRQVLVSPNMQVAAGEPLLVIEPEPLAKPGPEAARVEFGCGRPSARTLGPPARRERRTAAEIRALLLGHDVDSAEARRLVAERAEVLADLPPDDPVVWDHERDLLEIFTELSSLFRRPAPRADQTVPPSTEESLHRYLRTLDAERLPVSIAKRLRRVLDHYGAADLGEREALVEVLFLLFRSRQRVATQAPAVIQVLERWLASGRTEGIGDDPGLRLLLSRLARVTRDDLPNVSDLAREVVYRLYDQPLFERVRATAEAEMEAHFRALAADPDSPHRPRRVRALVRSTRPLVARQLRRFPEMSRLEHRNCLEVFLRRDYRIRSLEAVQTGEVGGHAAVTAEYDHDGRRIRALAVYAPFDGLGDTVLALARTVDQMDPAGDIVLDVYLGAPAAEASWDGLEASLRAVFDGAGFGRPIRRLVVVVLAADDRSGIGGTFIFTFRRGQDGGFAEERTCRGLHPMVGKRLQIWRLQNFEVTRLPSVEDVYVFHCVARDNPKDQRLVAFAEVRDLSAVRDARGRLTALPVLERMLMEALATIRAEQSGRDPRRRLQKNRVSLHVTPVVDLSSEDFAALVRKLAPATEGLGMEAVRVHAEMRVAKGETRPTVIDIANLDGSGASLAFKPPHDVPLIPLEPYQQKVVWARSRGLVYPYEIVKRLAPSEEAPSGHIPPGEFVEYDLDETGRHLAPIQRPFGENRAGVVVGVIRSFTDRYPEGMRRVILLSDPTRAMGALREPECRRVVLALDLAERLGAPVEWFAVSSGAAIAMETGTENLDWTARVLRRIVEHTRAGHEINVVVCGVNVGAQSYWNAEATMLMHCRGALIMASSGAMVLTGERALRYSGGVSAPSNTGIGGYELIMGPNGQAQYWARDVTEACHLLMRYYGHAFVAAGERFPRKAPTDDPIDRDVRAYPHGREDGIEFLTVGEIFDDSSNPGRKRPFAIRRVMAAVCDQDHPTLERWRDFREAEMAVVIDAHLGGRPVCLIGIESKPLPREGYRPSDGPERWTAGTLFPRSSKKVARAINACSGSRPVVVLANLSGFDGSPESMRELQLEYGAEIGRAVVRFDGPIVFCVISRYHGGAYVVFSNALNEGLEVAALEGAYASVIGGAPAAAVVFAREVRARTCADRRVQEAEARLARASEADRPRRRREVEAVTARVHAEMLGEMADEFDAVHTVERAKRVGSLDAVIAPERLRPYLIEAVERGIERVES